MTRVLLVRPWSDAHADGGCCSGGDGRHGVTLERHECATAPPDAGALLTAETYTALRRELPDVDVQIVSPGNTAYLLPTTWRYRRRDQGLWAAVRAANRATTPGALVIDGEYAGDVERLGSAGVLELVRRACR